MREAPGPTSPPEPGGRSLTGAPECRHCGEPVPAGARYQVVIDGEAQPMCCAGCEAVAETILEAGLGDYYRLRTARAPRVDGRVDELLARAEAFAGPGLAASASRPARDGDREATFIIDGINCAACAWLIERTLARQPGVHAALVNFASHRARVHYAPQDTDPGQLMASVARLGYAAEPYDPTRREAALEQERRSRLWRLGIAGLLGMQVMMLAVALYAGGWWGMDPDHVDLLRHVSLLLTAPVLGYCAWPWFVGAVRGVVHGAPGMDLPVALGLLLAFTASVHATVTGGDEVYFDSVVMFTGLLLLARYLEFLARRSAWLRVESLVAPTPEFAHRLLADGTTEHVAVAELAVGDRVRVRPGEGIPADGTVTAGEGEVDEALLSGESRPVPRRVGDTVLAGAVNGTGPLEVRVERVGDQRVVSRILALAEAAWDARPALARLADRVARVFVLGVLVIAAAVGAWWWQHAPDMALATTVAVLVVTCPCALSLATPTALTATAGTLTALGLVPARGLAVETLARVDHVVFDKTGTLTEGRFRLLEARSLDGTPRDRLLRIAAAVEHHSEHPVARALEAAVAGPVPAAVDAAAEAGCGISARIGDERWWIGAPAWVARRSGCEPLPSQLPAQLPAQLPGSDGATVVLLASDTGTRCVLHFGDRLRDGAAELVDGLRRDGIEVSLYSGDSAQAVEPVARELGIADWRGGLLPADKLAGLDALNRRGRITAVVGDGVNDAPVLAGAAVSVAMGGGAQAARARADFILVNEALPALLDALALARRARRTVAANMAWAIGYNVAALPLAAAGWVAPWMAALGMSLSSIVVVANSARLGTRRPRERGRSRWR